MGGKVLPKPNPLIQAPQKEEDETNIWLVFIDCND